MNQFTQKGGARLDAFNATWPFAKIWITPSKIRLQIFSKEYDFDKNDIVDLREFKGLFSKGILIEHKRSIYPHHVVFWTFNFNSLKKHVELLGYSVSSRRRSDAWWRRGP